MSDGRFAFRTEAPLGLEGPEAGLLWDFGPTGVVDEGGTLVAYFASKVELPLAGEWRELVEDDYLERYYRELECVSVGPLVIAPTHRTAHLEAGQKPLWIDPGMAFGTGHHETTRLALAALAEATLARRRVLDVGAGSGILAIAADLLGADEATGLDVDPVTVPIARANAELNRSRAKFFLRPLTRADRADLLVANLYAELHIELAHTYRATLAPGGILLITGILAERTEAVEEALNSGFERLTWRADGEWRLLRAVRGG